MSLRVEEHKMHEYRIDLESASPIRVTVHQGAATSNLPHAQHLRAVAPPPAQLMQHYPAAAQQPRQGFSLRDVSLMAMIVPAYYAYDYISQNTADVDPRLVAAGLAVTGVAAVAAYSPKVRWVAKKSVGLGCSLVKGTIKWGVLAPIKGLYNFGGSVGRGLLGLGSAGLSAGRKALEVVGKTGTALASGAVRVTTNAVAEAGKAAGTLIESVGNTAPAITGLALTAASAYYFGVPYLTGVPVQAP